MQVAVYDPRERAREKEASRERDERALAEGRISRLDLSRINGAIKARGAVVLGPSKKFAHLRNA